MIDLRVNKLTKYLKRVIFTRMQYALFCAYVQVFWATNVSVAIECYNLVCLKLIIKSLNPTVMQRSLLLCLEICQSCVVPFKIINFVVEWLRVLLCRLVFSKAVFLSCAFWEFTIVNFRMGQSVNTFRVDRSIEALSGQLWRIYKFLQWPINIFTRVRRQCWCIQICRLYSKYLLTVRLNMNKLKQLQ